MEHNAIKILTGGLIAAGIYLIVKGRNAPNVPGAQPLPKPAQVRAGLPMESMNCAVPISTDYLLCGWEHIPAVAAIAKRPARTMPVFYQSKHCKVLHPTVSPIGVANPYVMCQQPPPLCVQWPGCSGQTSTRCGCGTYSTCAGGYDHVNGMDCGFSGLGSSTCKIGWCTV